jgi:hypothetical protein
MDAKAAPVLENPKAEASSSEAVQERKKTWMSADLSALDLLVMPPDGIRI